MRKARLDKLLIERGLVESREKARALRRRGFTDCLLLMGPKGKVEYFIYLTEHDGRT